MSIFNELNSSLEEAIDIRNGHKQADRITRCEIPDVKGIRLNLNVSQEDFAQAIGVSMDTVISWESKRCNPTGLAAKVLAAIQDNPAIYHELKVR